MGVFGVMMAKCAVMVAVRGKVGVGNDEDGLHNDKDMLNNDEYMDGNEATDRWRVVYL